MAIAALPKTGYRTTDIKFAAFLSAKRIPLMGARKLGHGHGRGNYCEYQFDLEPTPAQQMLLHYQNRTQEAQVDASEILEAHERLKAMAYA